MKGYKGFNPGLVCKDKQYQENTVFEEPEAEICKKGMHFCENPFDVLDYYDLVRVDGRFNDFAEVEALYEKIGKTKQDKIILVNDNDEKRMLFENCRLKARRVVNPIIDWTDEDVYGFLDDAQCPMNPLYAEGQCRVGCIGCPLATKKKRELEFGRWPKYEKLYLLAFGRMLDERRRRGNMTRSQDKWTTAEDVFRWWMEYDVLPGQMGMEDFMGTEEA